MRSLRLHRRTLVAARALALASFLEICGCNLSPHESGVAEANLFVATNSRSIGCEFCSVTTRNTAILEQSKQFASLPPSRPVMPRLTTANSVKLSSFYDPVIDELAVGKTYVQQGPDPYSAAALDLKSVPWMIPESVFFVYKTIITADGTAHRVPSATAFVISVPDLDQAPPARFLVTARHVIDPVWAHCAERSPHSIEIRLNRRSGGVGYEVISLLKNHFHSFTVPADETSDVAIARLDQNLIPNLDRYKFFDTPFRLLPTDTELDSIHPGQQITTAGLLGYRSSEEENYPVSDTGVVSSNLVEAVDMRCGSASDPTRLHVWFIDAAVPQGVSGSPVYASIPRGRGFSRTPVLLGIQAMAWPDRSMAGVTPSAVISDLIQRTLVRGRKRMNFYKGAMP